MAYVSTESWTCLHYQGTLSHSVCFWKLPVCQWWHLQLGLDFRVHAFNGNVHPSHSAHTLLSGTWNSQTDGSEKAIDPIIFWITTNLSSDPTNPILSVLCFAARQSCQMQNNETCLPRTHPKRLTQVSVQSNLNNRKHLWCHTWNWQTPLDCIVTRAGVLMLERKEIVVDSISAAAASMPMWSGSVVTKRKMGTTLLDSESTLTGCTVQSAKQSNQKVWTIGD